MLSIKYNILNKITPSVIHSGRREKERKSVPKMMPTLRVLPLSLSLALLQFNYFRPSFEIRERKGVRVGGKLSHLKWKVEPELTSRKLDP